MFTHTDTYDTPNYVQILYITIHTTGHTYIYKHISIYTYTALRFHSSYLYSSRVSCHKVQEGPPCKSCGVGSGRSSEGPLILHFSTDNIHAHRHSHSSRSKFFFFSLSLSFGAPFSLKSQLETWVQSGARNYYERNDRKCLGYVCA
jgi:hypothetical protein